jgi:hypothetical protein
MHAAKSVLSQRVGGRKKTGFTLPIGDWMRGVMRDPREAAILNLVIQSFINPDEVIRTWQQFVKEPNSMYWSRPLGLVVLGSRPSGNSRQSGKTSIARTTLRSIGIEI